MTDIKRPEEDEMNRRTAIALVSAIGIAAGWAKPIINSIVLPAHAQTSACPNILDVSVIGRWQFTDANGTEFEVNFVDADSLIFNEGDFEDVYFRRPDGTLALELSLPQAPSIIEITAESDCVASELNLVSITPIFAATFTPPAIGVRI